MITSRADFWAMFAAAAMRRPVLTVTLSASEAAIEADRMLEEFDKRWESGGGLGTKWGQRHPKFLHAKK
jgi:hypothetical protein